MPQATDSLLINHGKGPPTRLVQTCRRRTLRLLRLVIQMQVSRSGIPNQDRAGVVQDQPLSPMGLVALRPKALV